MSELQIRPFPFTDWTESSFYRPEGLLTTGPVFQRQPRLPTMLGQAVYTFPLFKNMSPIDLASMLTLLRPMLEFDADARTYSEYDDMTARELFKQAGVTKELYDKFLKPLLLVGLFAPPEELSAAVTLETLYFYAAAHQPDFDICWCRGSVTERIFAPLVEAIEAKGGRILNGQAVVDVAIAEDGAVDGVAAKVRGVHAIAIGHIHTHGVSPPLPSPPSIPLTPLWRTPSRPVPRRACLCRAVPSHHIS